MLYVDFAVVKFGKHLFSVTLDHCSERCRVERIGFVGCIDLYIVFLMVTAFLEVLKRSARYNF